MSGRTSQSSGKDPAVGIKGKNTKGKNIKRQNKSKNKTEKSELAQRSMPRATQIPY